MGLPAGGVEAAEEVASDSVGRRARAATHGYICMYACMHVCVYIYIYIHIHTYTDIYIYIYRERERCIHIHTHTRIHVVYMYTYIYIYIERERDVYTDIYIYIYIHTFISLYGIRFLLACLRLVSCPLWSIRCRGIEKLLLLLVCLWCWSVSLVWVASLFAFHSPALPVLLVLLDPLALHFPLAICFRASMTLSVARLAPSPWVSFLLVALIVF